jgi:hypothetical protein
MHTREHILLIVQTRHLVAPFLLLTQQVLWLYLLTTRLPLFSKWNQTTDEMVSVIQALKEDQGYSLEDDITMFGDSAGGGLVADSILKMRDKGLGMPAAVVLWSP